MPLVAARGQGVVVRNFYVKKTLGGLKFVWKHCERGPGKYPVQ